MYTIQEDLVHAAISRSSALLDISYDIHKQHEFKKKKVLADKSLTKDEKNQMYDRVKVRDNEGTRRICQNCNQKCLATLYCEFCVRNYLKAKFSNWTSGNDNIDKLIQKCQIETLEPERIIEWISYDNLQDIKYLTEGGFSKIYTAVWIDGKYNNWNFKEQQLKRFGRQYIILKELENVESANQSWFEEVKSHLVISNIWSDVVRCYGLTQNPSNGNYMLVMIKSDINLRKYLQQNHNQLTWKKRIQIIDEITIALYRIHEEGVIHRDLHSGNILLSQRWLISDLGFCGPADKPSKSVYGNLPYIAPEVIAGQEYTLASDIYSVAMLMWEISSGQPPFSNHENDYYLAMKIIGGIRPKIVPGTPLEYENLMKECWDADPLKRPDACSLWEKIRTCYQNAIKNESNIIKKFFKRFKLSKQKTNNNLEMCLETMHTNNTNSSRLFTSKIYNFENLSAEPRNATEEEQEAFHSKPYDFNIPDNIDDFNKRDYSSESNILRDVQNGYKKETMPRHQNIDIDDNDRIYINPNLHPEEQDELEIPDDVF